MSQDPASTAGSAFVAFFDELRGVFLERETLFAQIELALLAREHVLVTGPPGTAKSAIASAVLSRILDARTGKPSLFARQLSESTVQTDLLGPVDFKVLTETGRTEYLTEDGMLGATHAFLDEVFDGRDMLLRSILNVLHERELKEGRRVTAGQIECAVMTTNRYLSEVLARSPELLLAFADRLSFVCFVPKSFARRGSRAAMLSRASRGQRPQLRSTLTLQQLDELQHQVEQVRVEGDLLEAVELLSDELERELLAQVAKLPEYVPTKYFSQRSVVKALWALKAAVVRDRLYRRPARALVAEPADLEQLRYFFLLGGPPPGESEVLLSAAADPRERAQLEIIRVEQEAFDAVLDKVRSQLSGGVAREAAQLAAGKDVHSAQGLQRAFAPVEALTLARELKAKLVPGPRHAENRPAPVAAARLLAMSTQARLQRRPSGADARPQALLPAVTAVLELARSAPELSDLFPGLLAAVEETCGFELERIAQAAEGGALEEEQKWDAMCASAVALDDELKAVRLLAELLSSLQPERGGRLVAEELRARQRAAAALRELLARTFHAGRVAAHADPEARKRAAPDAAVPLPAVEASEGLLRVGRAAFGAEPIRTLDQAARRLAEAERAVALLSPEAAGLRRELLEPLAAQHVAGVLRHAPFRRIEQLTLICQQLAESLRREGLPAEQLLAAHSPLLDERLREHCKALSAAAQAAPPAAGEGEAHQLYRKRFTGAQVPDGESLALAGLEERLKNGHTPPQRLAEDVRRAVAQAELDSLAQRVRFLQSWYQQIQAQLPKPQELTRRADAEKAFDRLVKSRFPLLAVKEGELARLRASAGALRPLAGELGERAGALQSALQRLAEDFGHLSRQLLDARMQLG